MSIRLEEGGFQGCGAGAAASTASTRSERSSTVKASGSPAAQSPASCAIWGSRLVADACLYPAIDETELPVPSDRVGAIWQ